MQTGAPLQNIQMSVGMPEVSTSRTTELVADIADTVAVKFDEMCEPLCPRGLAKDVEISSGLLYKSSRFSETHMNLKDASLSLCQKLGARVTDDVSTAVGSDIESTTKTVEVDCLDEVEEDTLEVQNEEEAGASEEAEFSLDGRLASLKRWRSFRARYLPLAEDLSPRVVAASMEVPCIGTRMQVSTPYTETAEEATERAGTAIAGPLTSVEPTLSMPGLPPSQHSPTNIDSWQGLVPEISPPPGIMPPAPVSSADVFIPTLLKVDVSLLLDTALPGLEGQIRNLSQNSLGVDTWETLLHPEPGDPEWQLVALVGRDD